MWELRRVVDGRVLDVEWVGRIVGWKHRRVDWPMVDWERRDTTEPCGRCWRVHPEAVCPLGRTLVCVVPGDMTVDEVRSWQVVPDEVQMRLYPQVLVAVLIMLCGVPFETTKFVERMTARMDVHEEEEDGWPPFA